MLALISVESISLAIDTKCLLNEPAMDLPLWVNLPLAQIEVMFWLDGFFISGTINDIPYGSILVTRMRNETVVILLFSQLNNFC